MVNQAVLVNLVRPANLFPIKDTPELLQPRLLTPHTIASTHPGVFVYRHTEQGEEGAPNVEHRVGVLRLR
jgi:hypothetical protein